MIKIILAIISVFYLSACAIGPYKKPGRIGDNKYELAYGVDRYAAMIQIDHFCRDQGFVRAAPIKDFGAAVTFACVK